MNHAFAEAELELRSAYGRAKNFVEGWIGESNQVELAKFIGKGNLLEKSIHLRNALTADPELIEEGFLHCFSGLKPRC